ncbi:hypothetical protein Dsin_030295 [Dipteronia sinensis]|uniref:RNase H type-1 domain-containing protein n=1 Tax=Dipteronia sinensis TaxID=43782 RepID=A0AAD9ZKM6_9ROSI|nr:hypothetical protein Dsin_030295 [Dipteronia sinensis]
MAKKRCLETWTPPTLDVLKFNIDESAKGSLGPTRMGGVLRNSRGRVLCLFSEDLGILDSNSAEVRAIHRVAGICASNPYLIGREIVIVSDSKTTVSWVNDGGFGNINHFNLIYDIRGNLNKLGNTMVIHNSRTTNSFANWLTRNGSNMGGDFFVWGDC